MFAIPWVAALLSGAKSILFNKYTMIALAALAAIGGGVLLYKHEIKTHVATAVQQSNDQATVKSLTTKDDVISADAKIDKSYDALGVKTAKEYDHVRTIVTVAPTSSGTADPVIVSTLNALAGMHGTQPANGVSDSPD